MAGLEAKVEEAAEADDDLNEVLEEKLVAAGAVGGGGVSSEATPPPPPAGGNLFREGDVNHDDSVDKDDVNNEVQGDKVTEKLFIV